jgi:hypothetical protein
MTVVACRPRHVGSASASASETESESEIVIVIVIVIANTETGTETTIVLVLVATMMPTMTVSVATGRKSVSESIDADLTEVHTMSYLMEMTVLRLPAVDVLKTRMTTRAAIPETQR